MVHEGKWTEFDKKTGKLNGNLGGWIGKVLSLRGATILQARFEGDGSILRLELSRPKKDPLLFFIEDSGFGLSRECMCTGLTGELGLAGCNQPKHGKKQEKADFKLLLYVSKTISWRKWTYNWEADWSMSPAKPWWLSGSCM